MSFPFPRPYPGPSMVSFSVLSLFASGEQGVWYDPSDFSTMFQDAAGTTPVTAVEQPVGLILDKSKGLALGAELVTNGTFDTNLTGWSNNGTVSSSWTSNGASVTRNASGDLIYQAVSCTVGKTYLVSAEVKSGTLARVGFNSAIVGGSGEVTLAGGVGTYTARLAATATTMYVLLGCAANASTAVFDNISVKEISGNHASQSTTTSRPVLSARVNLLTYSEQFDNAAGTKTNLLAFGSGSTANAIAAPDGTLTADLIVPNTTLGQHRVDQTTTISAVSHTFSVSAKSAGYTFVWLRIGGIGAVFNLSTGGTSVVSGGVTASSVALVDGWYRCTITCTASGSDTIRINALNNSSANDFAGDGTSGIYLWGADLRVTNVGVNLPAYQRIAAATDYDTTGFPYYLRFDGTDDSLAAGTINPGSVDKAQVFAGVRKLADVTQLIAEHTTSWTGATGSWALYQDTGSSQQLASAARGDAAINANQVASVAAGYAAPITSVLSSTHDIAGDSSILRANGTQIGSATGDKGNGNFSAAAMYIGRRSGTTLPFNGHLYGLITRFGSNLSDAQIASAEAWINTKTRAY